MNITFFYLKQLDSKSIELSKACEKHYQLEQELAFYKLDAKFDEMWKMPSFTGQEVSMYHINNCCIFIFFISFQMSVYRAF